MSVKPLVGFTAAQDFGPGEIGYVVANLHFAPKEKAVRCSPKRNRPLCPLTGVSVRQNPTASEGEVGRSRQIFPPRAIKTRRQTHKTTSGARPRIIDTTFRLFAFFRRRNLYRINATETHRTYL